MPSVLSADSEYLL